MNLTPPGPDHRDGTMTGDLAPTTGRYEIVAGWLAYADDRCTCAGRLIETNAHEAGCGAEPLVRIVELAASGIAFVPTAVLDELVAAAIGMVDTGSAKASARLFAAYEAVVTATRDAG